MTWKTCTYDHSLKSPRINKCRVSAWGYVDCLLSSNMSYSVPFEWLIPYLYTVTDLSRHLIYHGDHSASFVWLYTDIYIFELDHRKFDIATEHLKSVMNKRSHIRMAILLSMLAIPPKPETSIGKHASIPRVHSIHLTILDTWVRQHHGSRCVLLERCEFWSCRSHHRLDPSQSTDYLR